MKVTPLRVPRRPHRPAGERTRRGQPLVENEPSVRQAQEQVSVEQLVPNPAVAALQTTVFPPARLLDG